MIKWLYWGNSNNLWLQISCFSRKTPIYNHSLKNVSVNFLFFFVVVYLLLLPCMFVMCCKQRVAMSQTWNVNISCKAITRLSSMLFPWWMTNKEAQRQQLKTKIQLDVILIKKYLCMSCKQMMAKVGLYVLSSGYVLLQYLCSASLSALKMYVYNKTQKAEISDLTDLSWFFKY